MSLLNGISSAGAGLSSYGADVIKEEADKQLNAASLLNNTSPPAPATAPAAPPAPAVAPPAAGSGHGAPLDPTTIDRAHQVYLGLVDRGMDPTTAIGFAANAVQESNANPATKAGDMGAAHGLMMWRDARLDNYVQQNGHTPEQGNLSEQLDYIMHEVGGPEAKAWQSIQASAQDPAARAAAISQFYERPKDTAAEIARRGAIANQLAGHFSQMAANTPPNAGGSVAQSS